MYPSKAIIINITLMFSSRSVSVSESLKWKENVVLKNNNCSLQFYAVRMG